LAGSVRLSACLSGLVAADADVLIVSDERAWSPAAALIALARTIGIVVAAVRVAAVPVATVPVARLVVAAVLVSPGVVGKVLVSTALGRAVLVSTVLVSTVLVSTVLVSTVLVSTVLAMTAVGRSGVGIVILIGVRVRVSVLDAAAALPGRTLPGSAGPFLILTRGRPRREVSIGVRSERLITLPAAPVRPLCPPGPGLAVTAAGMLNIWLARRATGRGARLGHGAPPEGR
jgi:hypothetical protein